MKMIVEGVDHIGLSEDAKYLVLAFPPLSDGSYHAVDVALDVSVYIESDHIVVES